MDDMEEIFGKIKGVEDIAEITKKMAGVEGDPRAEDAMEIQARLVLVKAPKVHWDLIDQHVKLGNLAEEEIISLYFSVGIGYIKRLRIAADLLSGREE